MYWLHSENQQLKNTILKYINGIESLSVAEVKVIANYYMNWLCMSVVVDRKEAIRRLDACRTNEDLDKITDFLLNFGIDPL